VNLSPESEAHKVHYLGAWYVLVREVKSHARYKIRRMVYTSIQTLKDGFNLYCQALGRLNFIVFSSQSKEFRRDFVMSGLKALFLLVISNFPLQKCIFRCKTLGFGVYTAGLFPKTRVNNLSGVGA